MGTMGKTVRAKFRVDEFKANLHSRKIDQSKPYEPDNMEAIEMRTVVLSPVFGNGNPEHENTKFWNASPSGRIELGTINPEAWKAFKLGSEVYVDFTPANENGEEQ